MYFEFKSREIETTEIKKLHIGDVFRYNDTVYIKLKNNECLNIFNDIISELSIPPETKVEQLDYTFVIHAEE